MSCKKAWCECHGVTDARPVVTVGAGLIIVGMERQSVERRSEENAQKIEKENKREMAWECVIMYVYLFAANPLTTTLCPAPNLCLFPLFSSFHYYCHLVSTFFPPVSRHRRQQRPTRISLYIKASSLFTSSLSSLYVLQKRVMAISTSLTLHLFSSRNIDARFTRRLCLPRKACRAG